MDRLAFAAVGLQPAGPRREIGPERNLRMVGVPARESGQGRVPGDGLAALKGFDQILGLLEAEAGPLAQQFDRGDLLALGEEIAEAPLELEGRQGEVSAHGGECRTVGVAARAAGGDQDHDPDNDHRYTREEEKVDGPEIRHDRIVRPGRLFRASVCEMALRACTWIALPQMLRRMRVNPGAESRHSGQYVYPSTCLIMNIMSSSQKKGASSHAVCRALRREAPLTRSPA